MIVDKDKSSRLLAELLMVRALAVEGAVATPWPWGLSDTNYLDLLKRHQTNLFSFMTRCFDVNTTGCQLRKLNQPIKHPDMS